MTQQVWMGAAARQSGNRKRYHTNPDCEGLGPADAVRAIKADELNQDWELCKICSGEYDHAETQRGDDRPQIAHKLKQIDPEEVGL